MKISGAVLFLVVIIAALCCQVNVSPYGPGIPTICCLHFTSRNIPPNLVVTYKSTSSPCENKAIIFITKRGLNICPKPKEQWVQHIMNQLDNQKAKTQRPGRLLTLPHPPAYHDSKMVGE
ncbi:C-C motif chemokine 3-like 1 [Dromiciops gliroides]|uniref:C-C motif chemokine 3-like 1 n=1 Tax=Dromiciops gliroides TaxID=33562 RepID=UPI001CC47956|nr:C-C motif chemokine 3-like 1 [Dromiciops gliroides]